jgi:hypothetical protein
VVGYNTAEFALCCLNWSQSTMTLQRNFCALESYDIASLRFRRYATIYPPKESSAQEGPKELIPALTTIFDISRTAETIGTKISRIVYRNAFAVGGRRVLLHFRSRLSHQRKI